MKIDKQLIVSALKTFFKAGDVFEIRVLGAVTAGYRNTLLQEHIENGYFEYNAIDKVPNELAHIVSAKGVYFTANPVKHDLLYRRANKIDRAQRNCSTTDADIVSRRWLLIDCDAKRISGISSTNEEHQYAIDKAYKIVSLFKDAGWEEPIIIDSGNGAQLMYKIDMPADDGGIIKKLIADISKYESDEHVDIDTTVFNAARIWRLPGTMNCKGENAKVRPHRMSHFLQNDTEKMITISSEQLKLAAGWSEQTEEKANYTPFATPVTSDFNIDNWISQYCPELGSSISWLGGRKWIFDTCPFNDQHTDKSAVLIEMPNGAICFKCHHNGCSNNDWHALRDLREPNWKEKSVQNLEINNNIDFVNLQANKIETVKQDLVIPQKSVYLPFPEELYNVPGTIGITIKKVMEKAVTPNKPLALGGALALFSSFLARKVVTPTNLCPNVYILELAESGSGKNTPRQVITNVLTKMNEDKILINSITSGAALEDKIISYPITLWLADEFHFTLAEMSGGYLKRWDPHIAEYLLSLYTDANNTITTREKSGKAGVKINRPHLSLLASSIPEEFFECLNTNMLRNGLFARITIIIGDEPKEDNWNFTTSLSEILDDELLNAYVRWENWKPKGSGKLEVNPMKVPYSNEDKLEELFKSLRVEWSTKQKEAKESTDTQWQASLWNRYIEQSLKYALIYACSEAFNPEEAVINYDAMKWGSDFVRWDIENKINMMENRYYRSGYEKRCKDVLAFMQKWHETNGNVSITQQKLFKFIADITPKEKKDIIEGLTSIGLMVCEMGTSGYRYSCPQFFTTQQKK